MSEVKKEACFQLEVVKWEGKLHCCYLNNFRIAGGKPWAGGETVKSWSVPLRDLISAVPELRELKSDFDAQRLRADTAEADAVQFRESSAQLASDLIAAEQRIAELISEVASRDAALEELGCPFEGVSDLFNDYAKGGKRYQWLRAHLSVDDFPKPHPEWSQPSEVESRRIDDLIDAALNPNPEAESHE